MQRNCSIWANLSLACVILVGTAIGATKAHVISFGKTMAVQWIAGGATGEKPQTIKVRALIVDGRVKEYTLGSTHDVTERLFVVRRALRVNDGLPDEPGPRWQWQRGGWLLVDRQTGRVSAVTLTEFDPYFSVASWYRDYVAYCGVSDDGEKLHAIVAQLSRRKPVMKKPLAEKLADEAGPDSACPAPVWQRSPMRVSFESGGAKQTFAIRGTVVDVVDDDEE
jgi:hypothetical protein